MLHPSQDTMAPASSLWVLRQCAHGACFQGLSLVHFLAQPEPFWSHLPVSPSLIDWGKIMYTTFPTKCAYVELKRGRV